jgi:hypothetical protein
MHPAAFGQPAKARRALNESNFAVGRGFYEIIQIMLRRLPGVSNANYGNYWRSYLYLLFRSRFACNLQSGGEIYQRRRDPMK